MIYTCYEKIENIFHTHCGIKRDVKKFQTSFILILECKIQRCKQNLQKVFQNLHGQLISFYSYLLFLNSPTTLLFQLAVVFSASLFQSKIYTQNHFNMWCLSRTYFFKVISIFVTNDKRVFKIRLQ